MILQGPGTALSADLSPQLVPERDPDLLPRHTFSIRYSNTGVQKFVGFGKLHFFMSGLKWSFCEKYRSVCLGVSMKAVVVEFVYRRLLLRIHVLDLTFSTQC